MGHFFHPDYREPWKRTLCEYPPGFLTSWAKLIDGGLLNNGKHRDVYDGKVFWTVGKETIKFIDTHATKRFDPTYDYSKDVVGIEEVPWHAFVWWDNPIDTRGRPTRPSTCVGSTIPRSWPPGSSGSPSGRISSSKPRFPWWSRIPGSRNRTRLRSWDRVVRPDLLPQWRALLWAIPGRSKLP